MSAPRNYVPPRRPYIDIHNHLGRTISRAPTVGQNPPMCLARFAQTNVVASLSMPTAVGSPIPNGVSDVRAHNEAVARACRDFPAVFPLGLALSEVRFGPIATDELDKAMSELGLVGFVDHPPLNLASLPLIEVAAARNGLINLHCHDELMGKIARMFPRTTFIVRASAYAVENFAALDNLLFELVQFPGGRDSIWDFQAVADKVGDERILYGGDLPYYDYRLMQASLESAPISEGLKDRIAWENARALIKRYRPDWRMPNVPPVAPRVYEDGELWATDPVLRGRLTVDFGRM